MNMAFDVNTHFVKFSVRGPICRTRLVFRNILWLKGMVVESLQLQISVGYGRSCFRLKIEQSGSGVLAGLTVLLRPGAVAFHATAAFLNC